MSERVGNYLTGSQSIGPLLISRGFTDTPPNHSPTEWPATYFAIRSNRLADYVDLSANCAISSASILRTNSPIADDNRSGDSSAG